jgi:hypothetical protein
MKIFAAIYIWTVLVAGSLSLTAPTAHQKSIASEQENAFVLKASRKFKGAEVTVISSSGQVVMSRRVNKMRLIIDFKNAKPDTYRVIVKKDINQQEFKFIKK